MGWVSRCLPCPSCLHDHTWLPCDWCPCPTALVVGVVEQNVEQRTAPIGSERHQPWRWDTPSDLHVHPIRLPHRPGGSQA